MPERATINSRARIRDRHDISVRDSVEGIHFWPLRIEVSDVGRAQRFMCLVKQGRAIRHESERAAHISVDERPHYLPRDLLAVVTTDLGQPLDIDSRTAVFLTLRGDRCSLR